MITREQILALDDLGTEVVNVPAWGGPVRVRGMTMRELDLYVDLVTHDDSAKPSIRARVLTWCIVDDQGRPIFQAGDELVVERRSNKVTAPLWAAICRLSGLTEEAKADLGKDSPPLGDSSSTSPSGSAAPSGSSS